ncbi:MAG: CoA transferase [Anaerolineae bacterium]|nr:CoA transferase [Anaerolineae bacterium]
MSKALEGIKVLDLTRALAGPYCAMMLGDLGADVIKVERPVYGDDSRGWGPPFVGAPYGPYPGESAYFISTNRNKRSVTVNFKAAEGQAIVRALAAACDVLVENFRTGTLDEMGLGYDDLHALNPRLVYCSISGYGRTGPYAERPGYDFIIQAEGGLMGITGPVEGPPSRLGIPIIDITAGMFAASAVLAALHARERTGEGQLVDVSLLDASVALLTNVASNTLVGGMPPRRLGNAHPNITPYEAFPARDRWFALAAANEGQWAVLCRAIGCPELKDDPRFATNVERVAHRAELLEALNAVFATRNAAEWMEVLSAAGLPCGPINAIDDVFAHPQAEARELAIETEHPTAGTVKTTGFPYKLSHTPAAIRRPPPRLGEHTADVLTELLGYAAEDVAALKERNVI